MVDPIEIPDLSSKPIANKRLKAVVKSNPDHERDGFSQALKEKMEEDLHQKGKQAREDSFDQSRDESEKEEEDNQTPEQQLKQPEKNESPEGSNDKKKDDDVDSPPAEHIDLKA